MELNATHVAIRDRLLEYGRTVTPDELMPTLHPEATRLVSEDPFAFLMACSLDRGAKAETIWTIPYWLKQEVGHLDPRHLATMPLEDIDAAIRRLPKKPRYLRDTARTIQDLSQLVTSEFEGDAGEVWKGKPALVVQNTMRRIHGVGEGIAAMTVLLLNRCWNVRFPDWHAMNVKPDVHVQRVLYRVGVATGLSEMAAQQAATLLNPEHPGALDPGLWMIGRTWCRESAPLCAACTLSDLCSRIAVSEDRGTARREEEPRLSDRPLQSVTQDSGAHEKSYRLRAFAHYKHHICVNCGFGIEAVLQVAHLDNNHHNNHIHNLVILCPTCHRMMDIGLIDPAEIKKRRDAHLKADWSPLFKGAQKKAWKTRKSEN